MNVKVIRTIGNIFKSYFLIGTNQDKKSKLRKHKKYLCHKIYTCNASIDGHTSKIKKGGIK